MEPYIPPARAAAIEYIRLGLDPMPLRPGSRAPLQTRWNTRLPIDPAAVADRFADEEANIALRTGPQPDGRFLFAIDADAKNGADLAAFCGGNELPRTAHGLTPSGGQRFLFRSPRNLAIPSFTSHRSIAPGIEIMGVDSNGHRSKVVVAPSVYREDGEEYGKEHVWLWEPRQGIAEAPAWLIARIERAHGKPLKPYKEPRPIGTARKPAPGARAQGRRNGTPGRPIRGGCVPTLLARAIDRFVVRPAVLGSRNGQFFPMVCSLVCQGFDDPTVEAVATLWWEHWYACGACRSKPNPSIIKAQVASCRRAFAAGRIRPGNPHWIGMLDQPVSDGQRATLCNPFINEGITTTTRRHRTRPSLSSQDLAFLEALLVVALYERSKTGKTWKDPDYPHAFACTNDQLQWLLAARFDLELSDSQLWRLKNKFMTRVKEGGEVIRPSKSELAEELVRGYRDITRKVASVFDPRGPLRAAILHRDATPAQAAAPAAPSPRRDAENTAPAPGAVTGRERKDEAREAHDEHARPGWRMDPARPRAGRPPRVVGSEARPAAPSARPGPRTTDPAQRAVPGPECNDGAPRAIDGHAASRRPSNDESWALLPRLDGGEAVPEEDDPQVASPLLADDPQAELPDDGDACVAPPWSLRPEDRSSPELLPAE